MRLFKSTLIAVCFLVILPVASVYAADVAKIGIFDFQKFFESSEAGKAAQAEINVQGKKMESDLKAKGGEFEELKKRLEQEALVLSGEQYEEKDRELRIKFNDFKDLERKYKDEIKRIQTNLINSLKQEVDAIVSEIGKEGGYLLIIEKIAVLYYPQTIDMTDELIKASNEKRAGKTQ